MPLLTYTQLGQLAANGQRQDERVLDFVPVVRIVGPGVVGLLTTLAPDGDTLEGLLDWGDGLVAIGPVSLEALQASARRDDAWQGTAPCIAYSVASQARGRLVDRVAWEGPAPDDGALPFAAVWSTILRRHEPMSDRAEGG